MIKSILRRISGGMLLIVVLCICALSALLGAKNIREAQAGLETVQKPNLSLDGENRSMYRLAQSLRQDRQALEHLCRSELGVVRGDEIVYLLPNQ